MSAFVTSMPADLERRRGLHRMRTVATGLLVLAAVIYVLTLHRGGGWGYVNATAEASMVGAIADWFAVTALFRRPLHLPIPHTALIPTRKNLLARSLQDFVTENFLSEQVVRTRVADAQVSRRLAEWLSQHRHRTRVVAEASSLLRLGLERVRDEDVDDVIRLELLPRLADEPLAPLLGQLLGDVIDEKSHHGLVDLALDEADRWLSGHEQAFSEAIRTRAPWWTPTWLDDQVAARVHHEVVEWIREVRAEPHHRARQALDDVLAQLAEDLRHDAETQARAERIKARLLGRPQVADTALSLWRALRRTLHTTLADSESPLRARVEQRLGEFAGLLGNDAELRSRLDRHAADLAAFVVARYGDELTTVITDTIERWDGQEAANRIELFVGRDLQFIRINGTLVGGLAGLVIHTVATVL